MDLFKPPITHRTNSLGWAKSNCHTCQSASRLCDRKRPRCDSCTSRGIICGGYVQKLRWQEAQGQKTGKTSLATRPSTMQTTECTFVQEDGRKTRRRRRVCKTSEPILQEDEEMQTLSPTPDAQPSMGRHCCGPEPEPEPWSEVVLALDTRQPEYFQFPPSTLEQLAFFTWRFSPVTLTYDVKANPWHACLPQIDRAPFLLDAVRALAIRHRSHLEQTPESLSVLELKDKALSSFAQSIRTVPLEIGISVSLILIGMDFAESAYGHWTVYLQGVYRMIQAAGGIRLGDSQTHLRVQIAQLVWYDTAFALLSRSGPVFPREYAESVVTWKSESQWSLLALNGFPDSAFLDMYDVADAAAHASSLSAGHATGLEMKIWLSAFETEQGASDIEISALSDCWRLGLLLYCTRVFHQGHGSVKRKARLLAEEIIWLVHELPPYSNKQKQAVLPLFLAACEIESFRFRRIVMDFCERWKEKCGLWLNQTVIDLVEIVWAAVDENPDKDPWWGDFITPSSDSGFLFG